MHTTQLLAPDPTACTWWLQAHTDHLWPAWQTALWKYPVSWAPLYSRLELGRVSSLTQELYQGLLPFSSEDSLLPVFLVGTALISESVTHSGSSDPCQKASLATADNHNKKEKPRALGLLRNNLVHLWLPYTNCQLWQTRCTLCMWRDRTQFCPYCHCSLYGSATPAKSLTLSLSQTAIHRWLWALAPVHTAVRRDWGKAGQTCWHETHAILGRFLYCFQQDHAASHRSVCCSFLEAGATQRTPDFAYWKLSASDGDAGQLSGWQQDLSSCNYQESNFSQEYDAETQKYFHSFFYYAIKTIYITHTCSPIKSLSVIHRNSLATKQII